MKRKKCDFSVYIILSREKAKLKYVNPIFIISKQIKYLLPII